MSVAASILAGALLWALVGCATTDPQPRAIELTYRHALDKDAIPAQDRSVVERASGAYVRVVIYGPTEDEGKPRLWVVSGASGAIVDPRGYVITAAHIARNTRYQARVTTMDGQVREGEILAVAPERDLALLKIAPFPGMRAATLADISHLREGQRALAIGTPDGRMGVVSSGRIVQVHRKERIDYGEFGLDGAIELQMEVEPGDSGGPLFDYSGRLIGMMVGFGLGDTREVPYVSTRVAFAVSSQVIVQYMKSVSDP